MKNCLIGISLLLLCACSDDPAVKPKSKPTPNKYSVQAIDERMQFLGERYGVPPKVILKLIMDYQRLMYGFAFIEVDYDPASAESKPVTATYDAKTTLRMLRDKYGISESKILNILSDEDAYSALENKEREEYNRRRIEQRIKKSNG